MSNRYKPSLLIGDIDGKYFDLGEIIKELEGLQDHLRIFAMCSYRESFQAGGKAMLSDIIKYLKQVKGDKNV